MDLFISIMVMVSQVYTWAQTHQIVNFKLCGLKLRYLHFSKKDTILKKDPALSRYTLPPMVDPNFQESDVHLCLQLRLQQTLFNLLQTASAFLFPWNYSGKSHL